MRHQSWRQNQQWSNPIRLLIVEPSEAVVRLLKDALLMGALSASVIQAKTPGEALQYLAEDSCDLLLFSARFGVAPLREFIRLHPDLPVIALTGSQSEFAWLQSSVPGVLDNLPADSAGILCAGRKVQLAVHRKLTDKHQKNAQENIDRLGNLPGEAFIALDQEGRVLSVNESAEKMLGKTGSEALGSPFGQWLEQPAATAVRSLLSARDRTGFSPFQLGMLKTGKGEYTQIEFSVGCWHTESSAASCLVIRDLSVRRALETQIKSTLSVQSAVSHLNTLREQNLPLVDKLSHIAGVLQELPCLVSDYLSGISLIIRDDRDYLISHVCGPAVSDDDKQAAFAQELQESHGVFYFHDQYNNRFGFALKAAGAEPLGFLLLNEKPGLLQTVELTSQLRLLLCTIALMVREHLARGKISRLSTAIEQSPAGVVITNSDGSIEYANQAVSVMTGYSKSELLGQNPRVLKSGLMAEEVYSTLWSTICQGKIWQGEIRNRRKDGVIYWESMLIAPVEAPDESRLNFIAIKENIDQRKQAEQQLVKLATHDSLTGLPNRTLLNDRLEQALADTRRYGEGFTLLLIDLDDFSLINNQHGHQTGDELLKIIATRLSEGQRKSDTVGRQGGDEFLMILPRLSSPKAVKTVIKSIISRMKKPCTLWNVQLAVSCSIGIATCEKDDVSASEIYRRSDLAMYEAKKTKGYSSHFFDESLSNRLDQRICYREAISQAAGNGELALHYQPQIDLKTGKVSGAEALLRWTHPEKGPVSPAVFIPLAEEFGIINDLGGWVIKEVCRQLAQWLASGCKPPRIAINLSARQLLDDGFLSSFLCSINNNDIPAELLEVEITESEIMQYPQQAVRLLKSLRQQGVSVAVDDFGTGYSSLSYLKRLPLDKLKIDRSFVFDTINDSDSRTIAAMIVDLGHNLGLKVLAEGVENIEQLTLLNELGADEYQGFYCSPALPADEFITYLSESFAEPACSVPGILR